MKGILDERGGVGSGHAQDAIAASRAKSHPPPMERGRQTGAAPPTNLDTGPDEVAVEPGETRTRNDGKPTRPQSEELPAEGSSAGSSWLDDRQLSQPAVLCARGDLNPHALSDTGT